MTWTEPIAQGWEMTDAFNRAELIISYGSHMPQISTPSGWAQPNTFSRNNSAILKKNLWTNNWISNSEQINPYISISKDLTDSQTERQTDK